MNVKILLEYDGTNYHGWQRQKNARSIQEVLEEAISAITGEKIRVTGAGRTDAGVHAAGQVANFKTNTRIPVEKLPYAINSRLPDDIVVKEARMVPEEFHARLSAKAKVYSYTIYNAPFPSPLLRNYTYFFPLPLDMGAMKEAASQFVGLHDFSAFRASGSPVKSSVRQINRLEINRCQDLIKIEIEANGFLYNMVRIIAGTLLDAGLHKINPGEVASIIRSGDRDRAGKTLPPQGLCLLKVVY
ncbi:MAG: tRNA pseudouridine38-40 synthase [Thermoanaerobacteraceae bacterium]|jgi:tRNA pseudouridine38-40 synthase|uniref:tRNA pseudouridine synthase A n=1 Tax=Biomaibacter acetigenes TaxID=2316383 RepID=A0A3G2R279_9FIRM|nr:tRNA pseudouridine(38-40) synthase TruA [Biomaibacter acetigenes]AYO29449.1 tRNA pseudouridine(38-40) synthase TruA [Biomaibacter acetigenes]MDK2878608.1 tRNA pseudouridine38-40 synthase [Thermoanaerobacteraceae bacterium]